MTKYTKYFTSTHNKQEHYWRTGIGSATAGIIADCWFLFEYDRVKITRRNFKHFFAAVQMLCNTYPIINAKAGQPYKYVPDRRKQNQVKLSVEFRNKENLSEGPFTETALAPISQALEKQCSIAWNIIVFGKSKTVFVEIALSHTLAGFGQLATLTHIMLQAGILLSQGNPIPPLMTQLVSNMDEVIPRPTSALIKPKTSFSTIAKGLWHVIIKNLLYAKNGGTVSLKAHIPGSLMRRMKNQLGNVTKNTVICAMTLEMLFRTSISDTFSLGIIKELKETLGGRKVIGNPWVWVYVNIKRSDISGLNFTDRMKYFADMVAKTHVEYNEEIGLRETHGLKEASSLQQLTGTMELPSNSSSTALFASERVDFNNEPSTWGALKSTGASHKFGHESLPLPHMNNLAVQAWHQPEDKVVLNLPVFLQNLRTALNVLSEVNEAYSDATSDKTINANDAETGKLLLNKGGIVEINAAQFIAQKEKLLHEYIIGLKTMIHRALFLSLVAVSFIFYLSIRCLFNGESTDNYKSIDHMDEVCDAPEAGLFHSFGR